MSAKNKIFYAEASKGYILKVLIDTLCGPLQRGYITIDKDGLRMRQADSGNTVLYDIELPRKNFKGFRCTRPITISVNLKHMQGLLRNVKKKDSIAMFIDPAKPEKFYITIRPEGAARSKTRFETNSIVYQEEKSYKILDLPEGGYKHPMVIEAADFQKIKRLTTIGKIISVVIQQNNYLSFKCDAGVVFDSELGFGELYEELDDDDYVDDASPKKKGSKATSKAASKDGIGASASACTCGKTPSKCWCECQECGEYLCDCLCECEDCGEYLCDCLCEKTDTGNGYDSLDEGDLPGLFKARYYSSILNKLVKLPGLCTQMQFYAPNVDQFPLRIEVNAGQGGATLGTIQVFIKDVEQITYEESIKNENENVITSAKKGKVRK